MSLRIRVNRLPSSLGKAGIRVFLTGLMSTMLFTQASMGSDAGSISGIVSDASGAVVLGAEVVAQNTETGVRETTSTDSNGFYSFPVLAVGKYQVFVQKAPFKSYERTGLVIDVNTAVRVDAILQVGSVSEQVVVQSDALQVETASTQLGEVITGAHMESIPLNGRSYTDLLAIQPGVAPSSSGEYTTYTNTGTVSGNLNAGGLSINGQRETANGFIVNGADVNESIYQQTSIIPNLDSIAEFRVLTSNFNAEYGNYGGGQILVETKSGSNTFHGDLFEFLRNDVLDARNYFSNSRGAFKQSQLGGAGGGPIRQDKAFFFVDYQGTRTIIGQDTGLIPVPSDADRTGNLADQTSSFYQVSPQGQITPYEVKGESWAQHLTSALGYPVSSGTPYYVPGCTTSSQCVFPNAVIPMSVFSAPTKQLMQYIPHANVATSNGTFFSTSAYNQTLRDDKGGVRVDENTRLGMMSEYYMVDDYVQVLPYGAVSLPGFAVDNSGRAQLAVLSDTKSFGPSATALNEFRASYMRNVIFEDAPMHGQGLGPTYSSLGFQEGPNTLGLVAVAPQYQGVPNISLSNFSFGLASNTVFQGDNLYQLQDNFVKIVGTHQVKFGGSFHFDQTGIAYPNLASVGGFGFGYGAETGSAWADFLIGAPTGFAQGAPNKFPNRSRYLGLYAQDTWRMTRDLTLNYGLRWEVSPFWQSPDNRLNAMIAGEQSVVFPGAPKGLVFPGDPGVPSTIAPTDYHNFSPRLGLAYSPSTSSGLLAKITGGPSKTSIRAGYGLFYSAIEALADQVQTDFPYGLYYASPVPPLFETPFVDRATGNSEGQRFPVAFPAPPTPSHPNNSVNWAQFEPIGFNPVVKGNDRLPYTEEYSLTVQRQFGANTIASMSYVGAQGHRLLVGLEANPGNPALCLSVSQPNEVMPGTQTCGPNEENGVFYPVNGGTINSTRQAFGPLFASDAWFASIGASSYNSLQSSLRYVSGSLELLASYTYGQALDYGSGLQDQVNPFNPRISRALSAFDRTHNFVVSYGIPLPFDRLFGKNRLAGGWKLSGVTHLATGMPVTLSEGDDQSLLGTGGSGIGGAIDTPNYTAGPLQFTDPRNKQALPYFDTALFTQEPLGQLGTARRRFFHGPGTNSSDMALEKDLRLSESKGLQFRAEFFNVFNHTQFGSPNGLWGTSTFGYVTSAGAARIGQLGLKLFF